MLDFDGLKSKVGLLNPCNLSNYLASPPASLPEMPWLAMPYLSHFIFEFDGVKSKVGLLNPCTLSSYLASPPASSPEIFGDISTIAGRLLMV